MLRAKYLPHGKKDEKIVFYLRRHWFVMVKIIAMYIVLAILPMMFYWVLAMGADIWLNNELAQVFLVLLAFSYYLFWWLLFYHAWLNYYLDLWIVTNHRVINIEQKDMFYRTVAENKLFRIQDVLAEQKGILPTLFNYGQINIQTAGTKERIVFQQVPRPNYVAQELIKLIEWRKRVVEQAIDKEEKANINNARISGLVDE